MIITRHFVFYFVMLQESWAPVSTNETCKDTAGPAPAPMPGTPQEYASHYNAMIYPIIRYSIRAAFWFQVICATHPW